MVNTTWEFNHNVFKVKGPKEINDTMNFAIKRKKNDD